MDIHHNDCAELENKQRDMEILLTTALLQHIFFKILTWIYHSKRYTAFPLYLQT